MTRKLRDVLIVTADDYGIRQTTEPILRLVRAGKIDRVAVLIRYVSPEQAVALKATGVKIDLHLELIGLLKSGEQVSESALLRGINFLFRFTLGLVTVKKVKAEWQDQIRRFEEVFGCLPDGLNSHEHLHFFPPFFTVFLGLAQQYTVSYIRFGSNGMLTGLHRSLIGKLLFLFWQQTRGLYSKTNLTTSDYLVSLDWLDDVVSFGEQLPAGSVELVVHPEREKDYHTVLKYL